MKTIIVIGGKGLLGKAVVKNLITNGDYVIVFDMKKSNDINKDDQSFYVDVDINNPESLNKAIKIVHEKNDVIDCVINTSYPRNSNEQKKIPFIPLDEFNQNINIHLGAYFNVMQCMVDYFLKQGHGNIINISSIQGVSAPEFRHYSGTKMFSGIEYTASKTAIIAITRYMAKYLKDKNIRINCVSPGGILNNQDPQFLENYSKSCINKGMLSSEDIVGAIQFLSSDDSKFINGQNIIVDDGWTL